RAPAEPGHQPLHQGARIERTGQLGKLVGQRFALERRPRAQQFDTYRTVDRGSQWLGHGIFARGEARPSEDASSRLRILISDSMSASRRSSSMVWEKGGNADFRLLRAPSRSARPISAYAAASTPSARYRCSVGQNSAAISRENTSNASVSSTTAASAMPAARHRRDF